MANAGRMITLLTDFGLQDHFVAAMKGAMLSVNPDLNLVDISHLVPPHDIHSGAFILGQAYSFFPMGTVHLAVVDPGVGTTRKAIAVSAGGHFFVAPDNGILSYVFKAHEDFTAFEITADHYFRKPVSSTFHGRDIFAPIAAWISRDIPLRQLGSEFSNPVRLKIPDPARVKEGLIQGTILAIDQFGNMITNLTPAELPILDAAQPRPFRILAGHREITSYHNTYGEGQTGEVFVVLGSTGYFEIAMKDGSAASALNLKTGAPIGVVLS